VLRILLVTTILLMAGAAPGIFMFAFTINALGDRWPANSGYFERGWRGLDERQIERVSRDFLLSPKGFP
jgi:hypothetical protein